MDGKEDERRGGEGEGQLRDKPGGNVVVPFAREGFSPVGCQEERSQKSAGIWEYLSARTTFFLVSRSLL